MVATVDVVTPNVRLSQPGGDQRASDLPTGAVPAILLLDIQQTHRKRQDLLRAELRLNNHIEAVYRRFTGLTQMERARLRKKASNGEGHLTSAIQCSSADPGDDTANGGDQAVHDTQAHRVPADLADFLAAEAAAKEWCAELYAGRDLYANARKPYEKRLERLAKELPAWAWVEGVRGFGAMGFAQIVAECGDLNNYANPAKLWKRMGLAVMPDGTRQRKVAGEEAIAHGYSPQRRSLVYVVAKFVSMQNGDGEYRAYYLAEKERAREKLPDAPAAHIDNRALRHLAKRLLRDLWRAWTVSVALLPDSEMPEAPATFLAAD